MFIIIHLLHSPFYGIVLLALCFEGVVLAHALNNPTLLRYISRLIPVDPNSVKFLLGNPGSIIRSVVFNSVKGYVLITIGDVCVQMLYSQLADIQAGRVIFDCKLAGNTLTTEQIMQIYKEAHGD